MPGCRWRYGGRNPSGVALWRRSTTPGLFSATNWLPVCGYSGVPELHFDADASVGGEARIDQLLKRIHKNAARSRPAADEARPASEPGDSASPRAVDTQKAENFPEK